MTPKRITREDIREMVRQATIVHDSVRAEMLAPHPRKIAPRFTATQIAEIVGIDRIKVDNKLRSPQYPVGHIAPGKRRRTFDLAETRQIVDRLEAFPKRESGTPGFTMACVNFKGGSTKTSTVFNLAQGLALRGRKVLLIDLDPQASASTLTGLMPHTELSEADTAGLLYSMDAAEAQPNLNYAIRKTYWDGLDIVPSCGSLNSAELILPQMAANPKRDWWNVLSEALDTHRLEYDYILIDTAPSLSYLAVNAAYASDGLLMPLPPEQLDFSAALVFWDMVLELMDSIYTARGVEKDFKFIGVVLSKVTTRPVSVMMKGFIQRAFTQYVVTTEIPASEANTISGLTFGTIHDLVDDEGVARATTKLRQGFDRLVELIDSSAVANNWGA